MTKTSSQRVYPPMLAWKMKIGWEESAMTSEDTSRERIGQQLGYDLCWRSTASLQLMNHICETPRLLYSRVVNRIIVNNGQGMRIWKHINLWSRFHGASAHGDNESTVQKTHRVHALKSVTLPQLQSSIAPSIFKILNSAHKPSCEFSHFTSFMISNSFNLVC